MKIYGKEFLKPYKRMKQQPTVKWNWEPHNPGGLDNIQQYIEVQPFTFFMDKQFHKGFSLLVGKIDGPHMGYLMREMRKQKVPFVAISWDFFMSEGMVCMEISQKGSKTLRLQKHLLDLNKVKSVMYVEPEPLTVLRTEPETFSGSEQVFLNRWYVILEEMYAMMPKSKWFPAVPTKLESAQRKIDDLRLAESLGIPIPETLITNDPEEAKAFVLKHKGSVIHREYGLRKVQQGRRTLSFRVELVNVNSKEWKHIHAAPSIFQKFIQKKFDARVMVIGDTVLGCRINSQESEEAKMDWRVYDDVNVSFEPMKVSPKLAKQLKAFLKSRKLNMASFDLVADQKGNFYFLEMNRPGAWLFVELRSGLPIAKTIVQEMKKGR